MVVVVSASERSLGQELHAFSCFSGAISAAAYCQASSRAGA
jgi:hypothetical protein